MRIRNRSNVPMTETALLAPCTHHVAPDCRRRILFVGAERTDEFARAMRLASQGHIVTVVNPSETAAARAYRRAGGRFIRARIESLAPAVGPFHVICENYPYPFPSALNYSTTKTYALARLVRLAIGGRWVVFTENPRLSIILAAVARHGPAVRDFFRLRLSELSPALAPSSTYLRRRTRYRLIFQRVR
jgi:hypothetical protein